MRIFNIYRAVLTFIFLAIILLSYCTREDTRLVARVGGRKISFKDFEQEFTKGKTADMIQKYSFEDKVQFLDGMIDRQLKIIDAYHHQLDKDEQILEQVKERSRGIMFNRLLEIEVTQKVIPESELRDFFEKSNKEVKIKQILFKFDPGVPEQKQNALRRANEIIKKLKAKEDFALLAEVVSDDMNTAKKGGDKGYLKWGPTSFENPVYVTAFAMRENEISNPIETQNGFYIIKVEEIKKYPGKSFEQEQERIRGQLYRARNQELQKAYYEYLDKLRSKYKVNLNEHGTGVFVKRYLSPVLNSNNPQDSLNVLNKENTPLDNFTETERKIAIFSFRDGNLTIEDLIDELKRYPPHRRPRFQKESEVQDFVNSRMIPVYLLEKEAKAKNIQYDRLVKQQLTAFQENIILNTIQRIQVNDQLKITDDSLRSYFEKHREDYKHPEKRVIQQIYVEDKSLAENIVRRARRGEDFARLFRRYNEKEIFKKDEGKSQITRGQAGVGKPAFEMKVGDITDPIKIGSGFHIVKVLEIIEPVLKTFEEAKPEVNGKVRRIAYENREKEWIAELRGRINYVIYENNLNRPISNAKPNYYETE